MKTITINNVEFELIKPRKKVEPFIGYHCDENCIFYHYDRPSQTKINIWQKWVKWSNTCEHGKVWAFEIAAHNCMMFTIAGLYEDEDGNEYNLYITRDHNRAYPVG